MIPTRRTSLELASALAFAPVFALALGATAGCKSVSRFSSHDDHFEGDVAAGSFVRAGLAADVHMCVVLDAEHLQDAPGTLTTSDGLFHEARLRPIPQLWHDPLSTLSFGEGRTQNLVYMATPVATLVEDGGAATLPPQDVTVVMSLMDEGGVEVRLVRGAPQSDGGAALPAQPAPVFGVFTLGRREGSCSF